MSKKTIEQLLEGLHRKEAEQLLERLSDPDCPAAIFKEAREFLKDNNYNAVPKPGNPLDLLGTKVTAEDLDEYQH